MSGISKSMRSAYDFSPVVRALETYTSRTGHQAVRLSGWEVEDPAIGPPETLLRALAAVEPNPFGYANPRDLSGVRDEAAAMLGALIRLDGAALSAEHCYFARNGTQALLLLCAVLADAGIQRLVVAAPCYFAVVESAHRVGLEPVIVPAGDFLTGALDEGRLVAACRGGRAALLVTNPAYSIGVEHRWSTLAHLLDRIGDQMPVVLDETRLGLPWRDELPWYAADYPAHVMVVRSPSKTFLTNGMKLSLVIAAPRVVRALERLGDALVGSLDGSFSATALAYLDAWRQWGDECASGQLGPMRSWRAHIVERMRSNRAAVEAVLLGAGFQCSPVDSGPYMLVARPRQTGPQIESLAAARAHGVLLMQSRYFLHESPRSSGFRTNLTVDGERLRGALARVLATEFTREG